MEHIAHIPEHGVVVCRGCKHAVLPSHIDAHFRAARPHRFTREAREQVMAAARQMEGLVADEAALQEGGIQFPADTSQPIAALGEAWTGGLRCTSRSRGGGRGMHVREQQGEEDAGALPASARLGEQAEARAAEARWEGGAAAARGAMADRR